MKIRIKVQKNIVHAWMAKDSGEEVFFICRDVFDWIMKSYCKETPKRGDIWEWDLPLDQLKASPIELAPRKFEV